MLDDPSRFGGHDKRAPPILLSEGPACQVRGVLGCEASIPATIGGL
jgi:hypothetical protein